jgi:serine/threonine protein kinase
LTADRSMNTSMMAVVLGGKAHLTDTTTCSEFVREANLMSALRHPCIVRLHGVMTQPPSLVMELMTGGDLAHVIDATVDVQQPSVQLAVVHDIARALAFMHAQRVPLVHCDVRSANVMVVHRAKHLRMFAQRRLEGHPSPLFKVLGGWFEADTLLTFLKNSLVILD